MSYVEFRDTIHRELSQHSQGMTWAALKSTLDLPYERPCPEWVRQLENEIGLVRRKEPQIRGFVWQLNSKI